MTLEDINEKISELKIQKRTLEAEEREKIKINAQKYVGRCFLLNKKTYVKILGTPIEQYIMTGVNFSPYQFPAIFVRPVKPYTEKHIIHMNDTPLDIPFYIDNFFINENYVSSLEYRKYVEISKEEFDEYFNKILKEFKDVINERGLRNEMDGTI